MNHGLTDRGQLNQIKKGRTRAYAASSCYILPALLSMFNAEQTAEMKNLTWSLIFSGYDSSPQMQTGHLGEFRLTNLDVSKKGMALLASMTAEGSQWQWHVETRHISHLTSLTSFCHEAKLAWTNDSNSGLIVNSNSRLQPQRSNKMFFAHFSLTKLLPSCLSIQRSWSHSHLRTLYCFQH